MTACFHLQANIDEVDKKSALAGNRTRVARVASEHSTTEPPVPVGDLTELNIDY